MYITIAIVTIVVFGISFLKQITSVTEGFLLALILALAAFHIYSYNTDAEDAYIAYRYAHYFANGDGLVFNPGERVEGYSDFLWVVLLGCIHKITTISLPLLARGLGFLFTIVSIIYTYFIAEKLTGNNKKLSLFAVLLLSCSGCFIAYATSGLESPLFSLLLIGVINMVMTEKWFLAGIVIAFATMTRPEGIVMAVPLFLYVVTKNTVSIRQKMACLIKSLGGALILLLPWTAWRLGYYGYLIPNPMAAKQGMDKVFQLQQGLNYFTGHWLRVNIPLFVGIIVLFLLNIKRWRTGILLVSIVFIYSILYIVIGGDWMPAYRFYSPFYPAMVLIIVLFLNNYQSLMTSFIQTIVTVFIFQVSYIFMLNSSFNDSLMKPAIDVWREQVKGLGEIGKWFKNSLPANTVVATFPNGAFSFYNELYTIDVAGLTDEHIARHGFRFPQGMAGHIAHDDNYVLSRNPDIIAVMYGQGFEGAPGNHVPEPFTQYYDAVSFQFLEGTNKCGNYVNLLINKNRTKEFIQLLSKQNIVHV